MVPTTTTTTLPFTAALLLPLLTNAQSTPPVGIPGASSYNGLNTIPQMGWDNWNAYGCDVSSDLLLSTARSIVSLGLRDLGYNYVILDDCWSIARNSSGYLQEDRTKFPEGMKAVADGIHGMGLKFGMYSSAGMYTCAKYPGSLGNEQKDAEWFAETGVDYLKYDNCFNQGQSGTPSLSFNRYNAMSQALNSTGRPIVYSMCNWGNDNPYDWAYTIANSGRMSGDVYDQFNRPDSGCPCETNPCNWPGFHCSIMNILNKQAPIASRTMAGYFNDLDALEVGNGGQDDNEYVTHFSMWSMVSSPLLMGTNIRTLSPSNLAILSNPAVIAINQDPTGTSASRIWKYGCSAVDDYGNCDYQLWVRTLNNSDIAVALINNANTSMTLNATLDDILIPQRFAGTSTPPAQLKYTWDVHDLWGYRMSDAQAAGIINGTAMAVDVPMNSTTRYNATRTSYAEGLNANATALFGKKVSELAPGATLTADVPRHSVGFYRLRPQAMGGMRKRDEL